MASRTEMHEVRHRLEELKADLVEGCSKNFSVKVLLERISLLRASTGEGGFDGNLEAIRVMLSAVLLNLEARYRRNSACR